MIWPKTSMIWFDHDLIWHNFSTPGFDLRFDLIAKKLIWTPIGVFKLFDLMIWFDDLTKNEHDLIWRRFDLTKVLTNWFDLRYDLIEILSRWFDLRFDLTIFFKPLIWFEIWVISLHTGLTPTRKSYRDSCWQFGYQALTGLGWLKNHVKVMGEREILNKSNKFSWIWTSFDD